MTLKELKELVKKLEERLKNIPSQNSCANSRIPEGRIWCDYYNQGFAGRCNFSCLGYRNKYLANEI